MKCKIEVMFQDENDYFSVIKDGEKLMTFNGDENVGDTFYNVTNLLKKLDFEVIHNQ